MRISQLQKDLDALSLWGKCLGMRFNTKKTHIMQIKNHSDHQFYELDNTTPSGVQEAMQVPQSHPNIGHDVGIPYLHHDIQISSAPFKHCDTAYTSLIIGQA